MIPASARTGIAVLALILPCSAPSVALTQPAPSFQAECAELREALARLGPTEEITVIDVIGTLRAVKHDGILGYMLMCEAPDPQVLCITYQINDYKPGDQVILSGTLTPLDDDHVQLDPCLHFPPPGSAR